ncbi:MAG TPA: CoA transferase [Dehalococcoidia bacterium]|nr:CoA transferase [Dehalococcoidia bacterium]
MPKALEGIRILDATIFQHGPGATSILSDMGAEVIKLENTAGGDPGRNFMVGFGMEKAGMNTYFEALNRGKKSVTVNLKSPEGRAIVYRLIPHFDAFVHNYRFGVAERLGIDYDTLSEHHPKLVYAWASGWGARGPVRTHGSLDLTGQARGGTMTTAGEPPIPGQVPGIADQTGAFMLSHAITMGLLARQLHGVGQMITTSHFGSQIALNHLSLTAASFAGGRPRQVSRTEARNPLWNIYRCGDDRWIALSMSQADRYWPAFCRAIDAPEWLDDPRFASAEARAANRTECIRAIEDRFASQLRDHWLERLAAEDLLFAPIQTLPEVLTDPQAIENEYVVSVEYPGKGVRKVAGLPIQMSETPGEVRVPAPLYGEHTDEVLATYGGYTEEELTDFRIKGVIY